MKAIGITVTTLVLSALASIYSGFALSILWEWFMVSTFDLPKLSIPAAIGFSMIVTYLTHQTNFNDEKKDWIDTIVLLSVVGLIKPSFALFFGWIVTLFMV